MRAKLNDMGNRISSSIGERKLDVLLANMSARLADDVYVFATCPDRHWPETLRPMATVQEPEGATLILRKSDAEAAALAYTFPCRMITLHVHSALDAVGFVARISTALASAEMGVNPVAGYFHDHLFVPEGREADALNILYQLSKEAKLRLETGE